MDTNNYTMKMFMRSDSSFLIPSSVPQSILTGEEFNATGDNIALIFCF
jgi:hypothetical protein